MQTTVGKPASSSDNRGNSAELDIGAKVSSDFQKAKVLLVDDSRLIRMGLRKSLVEIGLSDITEASDGREAIETLVREPFDLMLLDMEMPEMNGMEVLAVLRDTPHQAWPPVIVISGGTSLEDAVRCIELGAEDYLSKPFRQSQLQKVLMEHFQHQAAPQHDPAATDRPPANPRPSAGQVRQETETMDPLTLFDQEALRRLKELDPKGDNRLFERVATAFENSAGRLMPQLEDAISQHDMQGIMHVAHTLKSSSASIGALKLSHLCAEIETMIRRQTGDDLSTRLQEVPKEVERVLTGLRLLLEQGP